MQIQKNSRQVPRQEKVVSSRDYCDLVYSWFQCESVLNEQGERIVVNSKVNYSTMSGVLGMDRRTISRYVQKLVEMNLLERQMDCYLLKSLEPSAATLVPYPTLRQIQNSLHRNSVSIFVYLLNRFIANDEKPFVMTYLQLKKYIGIATSTTSNNVVISDIMKTLKPMGLLEYHLIQTEEYRTNIVVDKVVNVLPA